MPCRLHHWDYHLCQSHTCQHCGAEVSQFATHGLSCRKSAGRHHRHSAVNEIIHRALVSAHVPSRLEPSGLYCSDGKRPDGVSIVPWKCGQLLVWDATCPDTFAPSYSTIAAHQVGAVAQQAEDRKMQKYKHLDPCYFFTPVAIETKWSFWTKDNRVPERVGASIEAGVWRSQLLCIPHSETLSCRPTWQCSFCVGKN